MIIIKSEDIAKILGISRSTVSRVINNYPDISDATRQKVLKAIKEYNYYPNISARKLAGAKNKTFGIFIVDVKDNEYPHHAKKENKCLVYDNMYFGSFVNAFIDQVNKSDYYVLVSTVYSSDDFKKVENIFYSGRIDAGIFIGSRIKDNEYIINLINDKFIICLIDTDNKIMKHEKVLCANINNIKGASEAIDYLVSLGHRNIGIITGDLNKISGIERFEGSKNSLLKYGININEDIISYGDFMELSGYKGMKKIISSKIRPTALFICSDTMAIGAYKALFEQKLKVPDDISIISFDDIQVSKYLSPPLTTVNVSIFEMASKISKILIESIEKNNFEMKSKGILIDTKIIKRKSCKKIV